MSRARRSLNIYNMIRWGSIFCIVIIIHTGVVQFPLSLFWPLVRTCADLAGGDEYAKCLRMRRNSRTFLASDLALPLGPCLRVPCARGLSQHLSCYDSAPNKKQSNGFSDSAHIYICVCLFICLYTHISIRTYSMFRNLLAWLGLAVTCCRGTSTSSPCAISS